MHTISFKASDELNERLESLAGELDRKKSYIIRQAIEEFLEAKEDYLIALQRLSEDNPKDHISLEQLESKYDLED